MNTRVAMVTRVKELKMASYAQVMHRAETEKPPLNLMNDGFKKLLESLKLDGVRSRSIHIFNRSTVWKQAVIPWLYYAKLPAKIQ